MCYSKGMRKNNLPPQGNSDPRDLPHNEPSHEGQLPEQLITSITELVDRAPVIKEFADKVRKTKPDMVGSPMIKVREINARGEDPQDLDDMVAYIDYYDALFEDDMVASNHYSAQRVKTSMKNLMRCCRLYATSLMSLYEKQKIKIKIMYRRLMMRQHIRVKRLI